LTPYSIGEVMGFDYGSLFEEAHFLKKQEYPSIDRIFELLRHRRLDMGVYELDLYQFRLNRGDPMEGIRFIQPLLSTQAAYLGFSRIKQHELISKRFSEAIYRYRNSEAYSRLKAKYGLSKGAFQP
jgi:hypothetical protein